MFGSGWSAGEGRALTAGATAETIAFDALPPRGGAPRPLILRRARADARGADALPFADEVAVIRAAAAAGVPVPEVHHLLDADDALGIGFVMTRVAGETLPHRLLRDAAFDAVRPRLGADMGRLLARIHRVPAGTVPALPLITCKTVLPMLRRRVAALPAPRPVFQYALRWLAAHRPSATGTVVLHGDFRNGNLMIDPDRGIVAVLDWEIAHRGEREADLAWATMPPWRFGRHDLAAGGFASLETFVAAYEAASGHAIDRARLAFWSVVSSLRWGIVCAEMAGWFLSGREATVERGMIARRASENEIDLVRMLARAG